ncbi:hypothetical protein BKA65DRAFT_544366 [Rhexocercosporidium sp. MPI-PUGE-AT-0058]|nr:hypothetical protein BKA65DRAFT_544366 [Rhexocercosporidium sp. MPI-PUGE-AT-0058]
MWKRKLISRATTRRYSAKASKSSPSIKADKKKGELELDKPYSETSAGESVEQEKTPKIPKTILEQDEELRLKLEGISGEGGGAGVEYEGGKAVGLKRGVRENMFRVI